jgi:hypothetical protein
MNILVGYVVFRREKKNTYGIHSEGTMGKGHLEDMVVDERIILKRILELGLEDLDWINLVQGTV